MKSLYRLAQQRLFWYFGIAYFLLMEGIALFYQYALEYYPCALCVQVRAWVVGAIITATLGSLRVRDFWWRWMFLTLTVAFLAGGLYTSWYAWGVEKGTIFASCTMGAGFPEFMPLDQWIPWLFGADGICGQSPAMPLGVSMVEGLLITIGVPLLVLALQWLLHAKALISGDTE